MKEQKNFILSSEAIDQLSESVAEFLENLKIERKNALRMRLALEEVLLYWLKVFPDGKECAFVCSSRFGRPYIMLSVKGSRENPFEAVDDDLGMNDNKNMFTALGLAPVYNYSSGVNQIVLWPPKARRSAIANLLLAVVLAVVTGMVSHFLPDWLNNIIVHGILDPAFKTFMGMLTAIAGPMVFLSVTWGIYSIGDMATFGRIGKKMIGRFVAFTFVYLLIGLGVMLPFVPVTVMHNAVQKVDFSDLYVMILDIIPANFFKPFVDGNSIQIIFIAIVIGMAMLVLGKKTTVAATFVEQSNYIVQFLMEAISAVIPVFVFISILQMFLINAVDKIYDSYKMLLMLFIGLCTLVVISLVAAALKVRISPVLLFKKMLPTFLIGLTTASSSAAFATNMETCERKLGIDRRIINIGVPLGQVIYMPAAAVLFMAAGLGMADVYDVPVTLMWLLTAILICAILSIAAPPVPGAALTCYTITFLQLGIPSEAIAVTIALNVVMEFATTAANLICLQGELILLADKLAMLDHAVIKK